MAQGKIKVKTQLPGNVKGKKVKKLEKAPPQRKIQHKTIGPKKMQVLEAKQMRQNISKTINKTLEERLVAQVAQDGKPLAIVGNKSTVAESSKKAKGVSGK